MIVGRKWTSAVIVFLLSCGLWASADVAAPSADPATATGHEYCLAVESVHPVLLAFRGLYRVRWAAAAWHIDMSIYRHILDASLVQRKRFLHAWIDDESNHADGQD